MLKNNFYEVKPAPKTKCKITVPGSKSITNRALLLAGMARGKSVLTNVLFSDDSRSFMECLDLLGFEISIDENEKSVAITGGVPKSPARINVRSAGTSARFITALLAACNGEFIVESSEQMKARPMEPLTNALIELGCKIEFMEKSGFLPYKITGGKLRGGAIELPAEKSSQFTSALLMTGCFHENDLQIFPKGLEISKSYIEITLKMIEQFGGAVKRTSDGGYSVSARQFYTAREYEIEPDLSSACYFYAAAALTGGSVIVKNIHFSSMQGDLKFLNILEKMGCSLTETPDGIMLKAPSNGQLRGVDVDMNDLSDQTMTLAAMAPFASSPTVIRNVRHIRFQESNRIHAVVTELSKMGIKCDERDDGMTIYPGIPGFSVVETYDDHRMAMAFSLIGLRSGGVKILNPGCVAKTFENYFEIFEGLYQ